jgi:hypothetical protein
MIFFSGLSLNSGQGNVYPTGGQRLALKRHGFSFAEALYQGMTSVMPQMQQDKRWALAPEGRLFKRILCSLILLIVFPLLQVAQAQKPQWRQATDAELAALLPARAPVEKEKIETEMRTASGIVDRHGHFIAGVVLLTAGYSADGKYSHYLLVQVPVTIGGIQLKPGEYVFGWTRSQSNDALSVHFHEAATGALVGVADAHLIAGARGVTSLRIWPQAEKPLLQIGRFGIPYELGKE